MIFQSLMIKIEKFFSLSKDENVLISKYRTTKVKIYFILQLGYFRATNNFYTFDLKDVADDCKCQLKNVPVIRTKSAITDIGF